MPGICCSSGGVDADPETHNLLSTCPSTGGAVSPQHSGVTVQDGRPRWPAPPIGATAAAPRPWEVDPSSVSDVVDHAADAATMYQAEVRDPCSTDAQSPRLGQQDGCRQCVTGTFAATYWSSNSSTLLTDQGKASERSRRWRSRHGTVRPRSRATTVTFAIAGQEPRDHDAREVTNQQSCTFEFFLRRVSGCEIVNLVRRPSNIFGGEQLCLTLSRWSAPPRISAGHPPQRWRYPRCDAPSIQST